MEMCPGIFTSSYSWNKLICKTKVEYIVRVYLSVLISYL